MDNITVSIHLNAKAKMHSDFSILTQDQTVHSAMNHFNDNRADKVEIRAEHGTIRLNGDGTWCYLSANFVVNPEHL
jgi:hypothetical protein